MKYTFIKIVLLASQTKSSLISFLFKKKNHLKRIDSKSILHSNFAIFTVHYCILMYIYYLHEQFFFILSKIQKRKLVIAHNFDPSK